MLMGYEGFVWWQGVVEDRTSDPLKLGRCKVRILGIDSENKNLDGKRGIPVDLLRWAYPMQPITDAAMNGIGHTPLGPVEGTWVFGFFRDGREAQDAVIFGTVGGIPQTAADTTQGFNDPNGKYPLSTRVGEPDTNRLARNDDKQHEVIQAKADEVQTGIPKAGYVSDGGSYDEPGSPYAATYPYNHVRESESGHIHEIDDTEGAERLHTYHRSGTFEEIHPDGTKVTKIRGDDFEIVYRDKNVYVKGNVNVTVDGDATLYIKGNSTTQVDGNLEQHVKGNVDQTVDGNVTQTVKLNVNQTVKQNVTQVIDGNTISTTKGNFTHNVNGNYNLVVGGSKSENVSGSSSRTAASIADDGGGATVNLSGAVAIDGSTIDLG